MANYKNGVVIVDDITDYEFNLRRDWQFAETLESFSYDYAKSINDAGNVYGATEPAIMEFSFRLHDSLKAQIIYNSAFLNENMRFSFIFGPEWNGQYNKLINYKDGLVADGYVVHVNEEFHSGKDSQGLERQTILHVKLLLRSVTHISGVNGKKTLTTTFVTRHYDERNKDIVKGDSSLRLTIWDDKTKVFDSVSGTGPKTFLIHMDKDYTVSLQSLGITKAIYRPNEIKARLYFYPLVGRSDILPRRRLEKAFRYRRVELVVDEKYTVCDDYFVQEVIPTYTDDGNFYLDLMIYSPDYVLTMENDCQSFVGRKLSDITKELVGSWPLPFDLTKNLEVGDMAANMKHLVYNNQEHTVPYLVQYNESIYDFLRRTANRWGEFMYYENGRLNFGYNGNTNHAYTMELATPESEKKDYIKVCHAISYADQTADKSAVDSVSSISLEAAQEFLDNMLVKDEYEEPFYRNMDSLGKAFTSNKNIPSWASDNLVGDLVSYGLAKKYTDEQRDLFNKRYFGDPNIGTSFNEFTENDPIAFKTFDTETYKKVLAQELSRGRSTIQISFDTRYPNMSLGETFEFGENSNEYYLITEISMHLQDSRPVWQAKAIRASDIRQINVNQSMIWHADFYPPYLSSGHTRKSGLLKGTVVDADDPLRQNRVRVRLDWQDGLSAPTPWLLFAQDGTTPGAGSHMRHYKGEQVLVNFIGGNIERPYVIGAIQEELPEKDNWDSPIDAILRTPNGQSIQMSDGTGAGLTTFRTAMAPGIKAMQSLMPDHNPLGAFDFWNDKDKPENKRFEGNVEIRDYYSIYQIKCSTNDRQVSISSPWGNVDINAFTGINISAPDGDVRISGKNVTVEAGNNLKLISGTNITNIKNRFLPEDWSKSFSGSIAAKAAAKVLLSFDEKGAIDFPMLRHIRDMFIKPVEGVLEVQSNRFLKLEADGASTGYPVKEYKHLKAAEKTEISEEDWYQMGKSVAKLIEATWAIFLKSYDQYRTWFDNALDYKAVFEKAVLYLKEWSEAEDELHDVNGTKICKLYDELKDKLSSGEALTEADMEFVDEMVGVEDNSATIKCENRKKDKNHNAVITARKSARNSVVIYANLLLSSIRNAKKSRFDASTIGEMNFLVGADDERLLPKDYMSAVEQALSREKCSQSELYKAMTNLDGLELTDETYKHLADANNKDIQKQLTALKHLVALNLLEGLGFKAKKNNQVVAISSLVGSEDNLVKNWDKTASYIVYEFSADDDLDTLRKKKVREQDVWSNAKNGQILISSGESYALGKEMKPIERKPEELRTEKLVKHLSKPIEEAMNANAIDSIDNQEVSQLDLVLFNESSLYVLDTNPKIKEDFVKFEKEVNEKKEEENEEKEQEEEKVVVIDEEEEKKDPRCYYQCGDILSRGGRYYVCVSKHKLNEEARFITLNDQFMHTDHTATLSWEKTGKDTVYSDKMASAETMFGWIKHVLLEDKMCYHLREKLKFQRVRGSGSPIKCVCHEDDDLRVEFIENLFSRDHFITNAYKPMPDLITNGIDPAVEGDFLPIKSFEWSDQERCPGVSYKQTVAPTGYLLVDEALDQKGNGYWVPYMLLVKDKDFNERVKPWLEKESSQEGVGHFVWEDMGILQYNGLLELNKLQSPFHVLKLAVQWQHEDITDEFNGEIKYRLLQDWTQNWLGHPNSEMTLQYRKLKDTWIAQNITSQEIVFTDNGERNGNYGNVWIRKEQDEDEEEIEYVVLHQPLSFDNGYGADAGDEDADAGPITEEDTAPYFLLPKDVDDEEIIHQGDDEEGWLDDEDNINK
jgi:hypothetical protein